MAHELCSYRDLREFRVVLADGTSAALRCFWFGRPTPHECRITHLSIGPVTRRSTNIVLAPTGRITATDDRQRLIRLDMSPAELTQGGSYSRATAALRERPTYHSGELQGYRAIARHRRSGTIVDFFVDIQRWNVHFFELELDDKDVLIEPEWANEIDSANREIDLDLPAHTIRDAPAYVPGAQINRGYCEALHAYYLKHQH